MPRNMFHRIGITTGDADGIGYEVTAKALERIGPQRTARFFVWRSPQAKSSLQKRAHRRFKVRKVSSWPEALNIPLDDWKTLVEIVTPASPARWVETAAQACHYKTLSAIATAPLSKQTIRAAGLNDIGHTDILKRVTGQRLAYMGFIGKYFNVVLATGHVPVSEISKSLSTDVLKGALLAAQQLGELLGVPHKRRPIGVLGLNPHAGDSGIIGSEELEMFPPVLKEMASLGLKISGPLVPDAAFHKSEWKKFSTYVAIYHDQGLIPFKSIHGHKSGVHLTLGLSLKRTSVDHGTAKDIFNKNKADPSSMIEAIKWAHKWALIGAARDMQDKE
jgi:4-hydroxythreonine-4-phosphate dehydrogenase